MRITEIEDTDLLSRLGNSELPRLDPPGPRTRDVLHLSDIYKKVMERREPHIYLSGRPMDMVRVEIGLLFEGVLERALAEKFSSSRPGEIVSDEGVWMSPDGVNPTLNAGEEYKATYKSSRNGISETVIIDGRPQDQFSDKFHVWGLQILGYMRWLHVTTFYLRVLFLAGDYSRPIQPVFKSYKIECTDAEVDNNWTRLMAVAREEGLL